MLAEFLRASAIGYFFGQHWLGSELGGWVANGRSGVRYPIAARVCAGGTQTQSDSNCMLIRYLGEFSNEGIQEYGGNVYYIHAVQMLPIKNHVQQS